MKTNTSTILLVGAVIIGIFLLGGGMKMFQSSVTITGQYGTCTDTDGGDKIFVKGTASDSLGDYQIDSCGPTPNSIIEWTCGTAGVVDYAQSTSCPNGYQCSNGACVSTQTTTTLSASCSLACYTCENLRTLHSNVLNGVCTSSQENNCFNNLRNNYPHEADRVQNSYNSITCAASLCTPNAYTSCYNGNLYYYDGCAVRGSLAETCPNGCANAACKITTTTSTSQPLNTCSIPGDTGTCCSVTAGEFSSIVSNYLNGQGISAMSMSSYVSKFLNGQDIC